MNRLESSDPQEVKSGMEWLGICILDFVVRGIIELPKDIKEIKESDEIVNDIGFAIANIYTDAEIVTFFQKLEDFASTLSYDAYYESYIRDGTERQEKEIDESQSNENRNEQF